MATEAPESGVPSLTLVSVPPSFPPRPSERFLPVTAAPTSNISSDAER